LGAGGAFGWVFHAGVLQALRSELGDSPDLIIGTSAGAAIAAAERAGTNPESIVDSVMRRPSREDQAAMLADVRAAPKTMRPVAPGLVRHLFPGGGGAVLGLSGLLPPGWFPTSFLEGFPGANNHPVWPRGLWIPAVRADDGAVVVFGRDRLDVAVHQAVQASSSVPGMFRPYEIDGTRYLDGGIVSPTHAHLAASSRASIVIVSSPMTRPSRRPLARHARRRLADERQRLVAQARGFPRRNPGAAKTIMHQAMERTHAVLGSLDGSRAGRRQSD
jgi:NTE family protein